MCAEIGAKTGIIPADDVTVSYLAERGVDVESGPVSDRDAEYAETWQYDATDVEPVIARPHRHDDVVPAADISDVPVGRAYIGACTGAKHSDLVMAAEVLRGQIGRAHV